MIRTSIVFSLTAVLMLGGVASADTWGSLSGRIVYEGRAPRPERAVVNRDVEFCGRFNLVDESLLVNRQNGGVKNVVVFLTVARGADPVPVHEDLVSDEPVKFDNIECRFEPRIVALQTGRPVAIGNPDPIGHNAKVDTFTNTPINPLIPGGGTYTHTFDDAERLPSRVSCNIHPWMTGFFVIQDHPYVAVTDEDGNFEIEKLPAGEWTFTFWHEKSGFLSEVSIDGEARQWTRGQVTLEIGDGETELGEITVQPALFER